jgi:ethanolamine utilization microcompartment shell protein EutL
MHVRGRVSGLFLIDFALKGPRGLKARGLVEVIVEKIEERGADSRHSPQGAQDRELRVHVTAGTLEGMKKEATVTLEQPVGSVFRMRCDEGAHLAGDDSAPPPLSYFSAAIAF